MPSRRNLQGLPERPAKWTVRDLVCRVPQLPNLGFTYQLHCLPRRVRVARKTSAKSPEVLLFGPAAESRDEAKEEQPDDALCRRM